MTPTYPSGEIRAPLRLMLHCVMNAARRGRQPRMRRANEGTPSATVSKRLSGRHEQRDQSRMMHRSIERGMTQTAPLGYGGRNGEGQCHAPWIRAPRGAEAPREIGSRWPAGVSPLRFAGVEEGHESDRRGCRAVMDETVSYIVVTVVGLAS